MNEADTRAALLVRAWETTPGDAALWSAEDRAWASRLAAGETGAQASLEDFVAARARHAGQRIVDRSPAAARVLHALHWRAWLGWALATLALLAGVASDAFGASREVNILAPPLLALMAWNLAVYAVSGARALLGRTGSGPLARLASSLARRLAGIGPSVSASAGAAPGEAAALARFGGDWARIAAPLHASRVSRILHLSAVTFAVGALAGMYLRGLAFEYRAGWESTFLDAGQVQVLLSLVLGPAAAITGIDLPDATALQAIRLPGPGDSAAPWIHLYAVTVALVVVVPRLVLAARARLAERRLAAHLPLPLDDGYFAMLDRSRRGETPLLAVLPWSHQPDAAAVRRLRSLAASAFGPAVRIELLPVVAYGDEEQAAARLRSAEGTAADGPAAERMAAGGQAAAITAAVALLPATATPEAETHGLLLDTLANALPAGAALLALVDESAFMARFGNDPQLDRRRAERRQAWTRLLSAHALPAIFVNLGRDPGQDELAQATGQLARALEHAPTHALFPIAEQS